MGCTGALSSDGDVFLTRSTIKSFSEISGRNEVDRNIMLLAVKYSALGERSYRYRNCKVAESKKRWFVAVIFEMKKRYSNNRND